MINRQLMSKRSGNARREETAFAKKLLKNRRKQRLT